jgi:hypothetical protein
MIKKRAEWNSLRSQERKRKILFKSPGTLSKRTTRKISRYEENNLKLPVSSKPELLKFERRIVGPFKSDQVLLNVSKLE